MHDLIENIARFSLFIPLLLYFVKNNNKEVRVILYLILFILIHQVIYGSLLKRDSEFLNLFNSFYTPIEFLITGIYLRILLQNSSFKYFVSLSIFLYFFCWTPFLFFYNTQDYISFIRAFTYSFILIFCLLYFYEQMRDPKIFFIYTQKSFWTISGFFLFAAGTFFIFLFDQFSNNVKGFFEQYVYIHALLFGVRNCFFSIAMLIQPQKSLLPDDNTISIA